MKLRARFLHEAGGLNLGGHPSVTTAHWRVRVLGAVRSPLVLTWSDYTASNRSRTQATFTA